MKRDIYIKLKEWKASAQRKPLILRGARQVGKTYILKEFAKSEYGNFLYINFEQNLEIYNIFEKNLEPRRILQELSLFFNHNILEETLLIFDEIQACPNALNSLKYFQEQMPNLHITCAGSLLGVKLANSKGFPVGKVNFLDLYPFTFLEFLQALERPDLVEHLKKLQKTETISETIHIMLTDILKYYLFVGGMPEAILKYKNNKNDFMGIRAVQQEILDAYLLDFSKHANPAQTIKINNIWREIPRQLAKENKKFIFSAIKPSARAREYENSLQWLLDAGLTYKVAHISKPEIPLLAYADQNIFKIYILDVGLLGALFNLDPKTLIFFNTLYNLFKGSLIENFVQQELRAKFNYPIYYWTSEGKAKVDFIISCKDKILPLEVKAGISKKKKSLKVYAEKYKPDILCRATQMNYKIDGKIINYPLYLISRFPI